MIAGHTVSVCTPLFNEADYIVRMLDSVAGLMDEFCVLDNACTDLTMPFVHGWLAEHPQVEVVSLYREKRDPDAHRNALYDRATKDWILVMDGDEWAESILSERLAFLLAKRPEIDIWDLPWRGRVTYPADDPLYPGAPDTLYDGFPPRFFRRWAARYPEDDIFWDSPDPQGTAVTLPAPYAVPGWLPTFEPWIQQNKVFAEHCYRESIRNRDLARAELAYRKANGITGYGGPVRTRVQAVG